MHPSHRSTNRSGIVLLIVLGMLALFSLLIATYVVFTSRSQAASFALSLHNSENEGGTAPELLESAVLAAVRGSEKNDSSLWGHDLLADLYGTDTIRSTVRNAAEYTTAAGRPEVVVDYRLVRIQTSLGSNPTIQNSDPSIRALPMRQQVLAGNRETDRRDSVDADEMLTGRYLTFDEGPLKDLTFRIARSYRNRFLSGPDGSRVLTGNPDNILDRLLVLDVAPHLTKVVIVDGISRSLQEWLAAAPSVLFYAKGANGIWGNGPGDNMVNAAAVSTDDLGYTFFINGRIANGRGYGWQPTTASQANITETGTTGAGITSDETVSVALAPHYRAYRETLPLGDTDEPYDLPDYRDMFLAHFPSDAQLGVSAPSFVRPDLVNYHLGSFKKSLDSMTLLELRALLRMLEVSTLRPLPITGDPLYGERFKNFYGPDATGLTASIDFSRSDAAAANYLRGEVMKLLAFLTQGPWDVDNDGDGVADSVWIDAGLAPITSRTGELVQPMVAYRIEDLSGRIDINSAGSLALLNVPANAYSGSNAKTVRGPFARPIPDPQTPTYDGTTVPLNPGNPADSTYAESYPVALGAGLGFGPADIDLTPLIPDAFKAANFLRSRYYDRRDTVSFWNTPVNRRGGFPGFGVAADSPGQINEDFGRYRSPGRPAAHDLPGRPQPPVGTRHRLQFRAGLPQDTWGRSRIAVDPYGAPVVSTVTNQVYLDPLAENTVVDGNEVINDPYEQYVGGVRIGDAEFTVEELEPLLNFYAYRSGQSADGLINALREAATNPRAVLPPELIAWRSVLTTLSKSRDLPLGTLPVEFRSTAGMIDQPVDPLRRLAMAFGTDVDVVNAVFAPELRLGRKLDLNRPLGNGLNSDTNDFTIDDPEELLTPEQMYLTRTGGTNKLTKVGDFTPEQAYATTDTGEESRTLLARHLYGLAMCIMHDPDSSAATPIFNFEDPSLTLPTGTTWEQYTAWRLAQWAVNVVDFRDSDAIMTRFVYDENPFDGWDVSVANTDVRAVWGMEAPELLLTESLAFHDRRVKDLDEGGKTLPDATSSWADGDEDSDQFRKPEGSLFLELFCPRSPMQVAAPAGPMDDNPQPFAAPAELYDAIGAGQTEVALNLAAEAPDNNPVWRIAISEPHPGGQIQGTNLPSPDGRLADPDALLSSTFQIRQAPDPSSAPPPVKRDLAVDAFETTDLLGIDRVIWMTPRDPNSAAVKNNLPQDTKPEAVYYNRFTAADYSSINDRPYLKGGQYAVIGPRALTFIGAKESATTTDKFSYHSKQRIALSPTQLRMYDFSGPLPPAANEPTVTPRYEADKPDRIEPNPTPPNPPAPERIRPVVGILAAASLPSNWTAGNGAQPHIGVNISEPVPGTSYYQQPDAKTTPTDNSTYKDMYTTPVDEPLDKLAGRPLTDRPEAQRTGTSLDFRTAFLQRLADPTRAYNAITNPYITVDWMPLDLTVFNGEEYKNDTDVNGVAQNVDEDDPEPFATAPMFASRYKTGEPADGSSASALPNIIWSPRTAEPVDATVSATADAVFKYPVVVAKDINHGGTATEHCTTLGYLNHSFGKRWEQPATRQDAYVRWLGVPSENAFPWIPWFNRDFNTPYELMHVPSSGPGRAGIDFTLPPAGLNQYDGRDPDAIRGNFGGLLNYFANDVDGSSGAYTRESPNFYRILDWVTTPQPFDHLSEMIGPHNVPALYPQTANPKITDDVWPPPINPNPTPAEMQTFANRYIAELFKAPFNWVEPNFVRGRVNLNTVANPSVYQALMRRSSQDATEFTSGAFWSDYVSSRRGGPVIAATPPANLAASPSPNLMAGLNPEMPTQFPGAFQPPESVTIAPPLYPTTADTAGTRLRGEAVNGGILRQSPGTPTKGLFERTGTEPATEGDRHSYFRYADIARLSNLATNNSDVFVVWVTVGLFEIDEATGGVGREYVGEGGGATRSRAMYIIDRSIPVAYEPGRDRNSSAVIVLSRLLN